MYLCRLQQKVKSQRADSKTACTSGLDLRRCCQPQGRNWAPRGLESGIANGIEFSALCDGTRALRRRQPGRGSAQGGLQSSLTASGHGPPVEGRAEAGRGCRHAQGRGRAETAARAGVPSLFAVRSGLAYPMASVLAVERRD